MTREKQFVNCLAEFCNQLVKTCDFDYGFTIKIPEDFYLHLKEYCKDELYKYHSQPPISNSEIVFYGPNGKIKIEKED